MVPQPPAEPSEPHEKDAAYEEASRSTADFVQNIQPLQEKKKKSHRRMMVLAIFVMLVGLAMGGYFLFVNLQKTDDKKQPEQPAQSSERESSLESEDGLKRYTSNDFNLSFEYPTDWKLDDQQEMITLESPVTKLPDQAGQEVDAKIILTIVPTSADLKDFPDDRATGVMESEKFKYDSPAEGQRQETFLSFMNIDGASDGLNALYITGDSSYVKGDPVTKADFEKVEPVIGLSFVVCPDQACSGDQRLTLSSEAWGSADMLDKAFSILKSLSIK